MRFLGALLGAIIATPVFLLTTLPAEAASGPFRFTRIQHDSPGTDTGSNTSLNGEYVTIKNISSSRRSLAGYRVKDLAGHRYDFGAPVLNPGQSLRLYTGLGQASNGTLVKRYWGKAGYVWNNGGDKAYLTKDGTVRDSCVLPGSVDAVAC